MADTVKKLRLFASSPSDLAPERARIETIARSLQPLAGFFGISVEVVDWIKVLPRIARPEELMFNPLKKPADWDVFVGLVWNRFENPGDSRDILSNKLSPSGTEHEFKTAYSLWQKFKKPRIWLYRKVPTVSPDALDPEQFQKVTQFFAQFNATTGEHPGFYHHFETLAEFETMLLEDVQKLLLEISQIKESPNRRDDISKNLTSTRQATESTDSGPARPETDTYIASKKMVIEMSLPGVIKENINLTIESRTITISGKSQIWVEGVKYLTKERMDGDFARTIDLPRGYDHAKAKATYQNGVLTIEIPLADDCGPIIC